MRFFFPIMISFCYKNILICQSLAEPVCKLSPSRQNIAKERDFRVEPIFAVEQKGININEEFFMRIKLYETLPITNQSSECYLSFQSVMHSICQSIYQYLSYLYLKTIIAE